MVSEVITEISPNVEVAPDPLYLWLELCHTPHVFDYPLTPQNRFVIGDDDPVDKAIRFAVTKYLSRETFHLQNSPALNGLPVFACSPSPILDKADLGHYFERSLRAYLQPSSWDERGLQDTNAETTGYVVRLEFAAVN